MDYDKLTQGSQISLQEQRAAQLEQEHYELTMMRNEAEIDEETDKIENIDKGLAKLVKKIEMSRKRAVELRTETKTTKR